MPLNRFTRGTYVQNLSQIGPGVWSVEGGAIDFGPAHVVLRALLYTFYCLLIVYWILIHSFSVPCLFGEFYFYCLLIVCWIVLFLTPDWLMNCPLTVLGLSVELSFYCPWSSIDFSFSWFLLPSHSVVNRFSRVFLLCFLSDLLDILLPFTTFFVPYYSFYFFLLPLFAHPLTLFSTLLY